MHLFLSPHPDDVVLSCGGYIHRLIAGGDTVVVLTLMAQDAPATILDYDFIQELHRRWDMGHAPYALRRREDKAALASLGVEDVRFGSWHDAIYRTSTDGQLLYINVDGIFGEIHPQDSLGDAVLDFAGYPQVTNIYVPLGAGNHVDHRLVRDAALRGRPNHLKLWFYEEYPYSAETAEILYTHSGDAERAFGQNAIELAKHQIEGVLTKHTIGFNEDDMVAKVGAIENYQSQLSSFWDSVEAMQQSVVHHARVVGESAGRDYGERLWLLDSNLHKSEEIA